MRPEAALSELSAAGWKADVVSTKGGAQSTGENRSRPEEQRPLTQGLQNEPDSSVTSDVPGRLFPCTVEEVESVCPPRKH